MQGQTFFADHKICTKVTENRFQLYFYSLQKLIWSDVTIHAGLYFDREQGTKRWSRNNRKVTTLPSAVEGKCKILTGIF